MDKEDLDLLATGGFGKDGKYCHPINLWDRCLKCMEHLANDLSEEKHSVQAELDQVKKERDNAKFGCYKRDGYILDLEHERDELRDIVARAHFRTELTYHAEQEKERDALKAALEVAVDALKSCDIALKAAKPCVNGGENMNDEIAQEALAKIEEMRK